MICDGDPCTVYFRSNVMDDQELSENTASVPLMAEDRDSSSGVKVRKNFPETWLWESVESG